VGRQPESDELINEHLEVDNMQNMLAAAKGCIAQDEFKLAVAYSAEMMRKRFGTFKCVNLP
jgi:hypothetical protein